MFLIRPFPDPQESLQGYLLRLARVNGYNEKEINKLRSTTNPPKIHHSIFSSTLHSDMLLLVNWCKHFSILNLVDPYLIPRFRFLIDTNNVKICPLCIQNKPIFKYHWHFKNVDSCLLHHCYLINECSYCKTRLTWQSFISCKCSFCNTLLNEMDVVHLDTDKYTAIISGILDGLYVDNDESINLGKYDLISSSTSERYMLIMKNLYIFTLNIYPFLHLMSSDICIHSIINNNMLPEHIRIKNVSVDSMHDRPLFFKWFSEYLKKSYQRDVSFFDLINLIKNDFFIWFRWSLRLFLISGSNSIDDLYISIDTIAEIFDVKYIVISEAIFSMNIDTYTVGYHVGIKLKDLEHMRFLLIYTHPQEDEPYLKHIRG